MIAGYFLEQVLGLILAIVVITSSRSKSSSFRNVSERSLGSFHDCATFFAFSIQIAAIVVLMREDLGISTTAMGDSTVRITQAVSVLVLLPLLYTLIALSKHDEHAGQDSTSAEKAEEIGESSREASQQQRFVLLVLCWLLAFYPFFSKMNAVFRSWPSGIIPQTGPNSFGVIEDMCTKRVAKLSVAESGLMTAFEILSYVPLSVIILGRVFWLGLEKHHSDSKTFATLLDWRHKYLKNRTAAWMRTGCLAAIPLLACGLLWTVLRTQRFQQQIAAAICNGGTNCGDTDAQWTFGQVVAITIFAPVVVETWSAVRESRVSVEGPESRPHSDVEAAATMKSAGD